MNTTEKFEFTNDNGRPFGLRILRAGDKYGRNRTLTHEDHDRMSVEFYDLTYRNQKGFGEEGQFVSRYYVETLLENPNDNAALQLDGGVPEWTIGAEEMVAIRAWLKILK